MGTEILVLFMPVPFLFWSWNIWQITRKRSRLEGVLLLFIGLMFMCYMVLPITTRQYFMQGFMFGAFAYPVFYLFALIFVKGGVAAYHRRRKVCA